jgi:hypothetical protein
VVSRLHVGRELMVLDHGMISLKSHYSAIFKNQRNYDRWDMNLAKFMLFGYLVLILCLREVGSACLLHFQKTSNVKRERDFDPATHEADSVSPQSIRNQRINHTLQVSVPFCSVL